MKKLCSLVLILAMALGMFPATKTETDATEQATRAQTAQMLTNYLK